MEPEPHRRFRRFLSRFRTAGSGSGSGTAGSGSVPGSVRRFRFRWPALAEGKEDAEVKRSHQPLPILEVLCKSTGKIRRFAAGTEAGFAVSLINKRLLSNGGSGAGGEGNCLLATHVEAVKEGEEEPISFGPSALLVDYGSGWKLQTAIESNGNKEEVRICKERVRKANAEPELFGDSYPTASKQSSPISLVYIGKILLAFLLLFVFGAAFTLLLENLPQFILYINSSI